MQCQFCGVNHDVRDFIRATLLHILDLFETSSMFKHLFKDFFNEKQFTSKGMNVTPIQEKSEIKEQGKERLDNLATDARDIAESIMEKSSGVNVIKVEQTQTKDGIKVILHRIELAAEYIAAFLTVENSNSNYWRVEISDKASTATQGDYESKVTSKGPNYKSLKYIKNDAKQYGTVKFEGLPYNGPSIRFEFLFFDARRADNVFGVPRSERVSRWSFVFEVQIRK